MNILHTVMNWHSNKRIPHPAPETSENQGLAYIMLQAINAFRIWIITGKKCSSE